MARKKSSPRKAASAKTKASKKTAPKPEAASTQTSAYGDLAGRTLDMWREQMMALAESPRAVQELSKTMQPLIGIFTQALDMWLMMAEKAGAGIQANAWTDHFTGSNNSGSHAKPATAKGSKKSAKTAAKPAAAAPLHGNRNATVAELAKRVAGLKQRSTGPVARVASAAAANEDSAGARPRRRRKA